MDSRIAAYIDTIGVEPTTINPANSTLFVADSRYRSNYNRESPFNFSTKLTNNLDVSELYYQRLTWSQPFYTHNLNNNLLYFSIRFSTSTNTNFYTYMAILARPWFSYKSMDGNPAGSVLQTPNPNIASYALMMEGLLNNQCRNPNILQNLYQNGLIAGQPSYYNPNTGIEHKCEIRFRYNSATGFVLYAIDPLDSTVQLQIKIFTPQSTWVTNGHFIHGFGSYNSNLKTYTIQNEYVFAHLSDTAPLLLSDRYIIILSDELSKNRKLPSFHSNESGSFNSEVAVFQLDYKNSNVMHNLKAETDSTTLNIRVGNAPDLIGIRIEDSAGSVIQCENVMDKFFNEAPGVDVSTIPPSIPFVPSRFVDSSQVKYGSCSDWWMMNYLYFGNYGDYWALDYTKTKHYPAITINVNNYSNIIPQNYSYGNGFVKASCDDVIHSFTCILRFS